MVIHGHASMNGHMLIYGAVSALVILIPSYTDKKKRRDDLFVAAFVTTFLVMLVPISLLEGWLRPATVDAQLRAWDMALYLDGFAFARWCWSNRFSVLVLTVAYDALPIMFALNWTLERSKLFFWAATIGGILAAPFYVLVPACGPRWAFADYPYSDHSLVAISSAIPRNCFPSMHLAWALLLFLNARGKVWKTILGVYAVMIAMATVGGGEHYFVDLIAAVPFTLAVQYAAERFYQMHCRTEAATIDP